MNEDFLALVILRMRPLLGPLGRAGLDLADRNLEYLRTLPDSPAHFAVWRSIVLETVLNAILGAILLATEPDA